MLLRSFPIDRYVLLPLVWWNVSSGCAIDDRVIVPIDAGPDSNVGTGGASHPGRGNTGGRDGGDADAVSDSGEQAAGGRGSGGGSANGGAGGGGEPGHASSGGSGASAGSGGNDGGLSECASARVSDLGINVVGGTTVGAENRFSPSCAFGTAPDIAFDWTVPATDYYVIDSFGSDFDTVLSVHASCEAPDFWCNDNAPSVVQSQLVARFDEGQTVSIVVGGRLGAT